MVVAALVVGVRAVVLSVAVRGQRVVGMVPRVLHLSALLGFLAKWFSLQRREEFLVLLLHLGLLRLGSLQSRTTRRLRRSDSPTARVRQTLLGKGVLGKENTHLFISSLRGGETGKMGSPRLIPWLLNDGVAVISFSMASSLDMKAG